MSIGPPIIGGEARWKFLKIWALCMDKISKFSPNMLGSQQACMEKFKFCSDSPSGHQKIQIHLNQPVRPPKTAILFGSASKNCSFAPRWCKCCIKSLCIHLCITHPASTFLASHYNSFDRPQYILKFPLQLIEDLKLHSSRVSVQPSWLRVGVAVRVWRKPIHSLSFHLWWIGSSGVLMRMGFWVVIGLSKYQVSKTINKCDKSEIFSQVALYHNG
jgi:hypothetical protein